MNISDMNTEMDKLTTKVSNIRSRLGQAKEHITASAPILANIPTEFLELRTAIDDLPSGTLYNDLKKEELALVIIEYLALLAADNIAITALGSIIEF